MSAHIIFLVPKLQFLLTTFYLMKKFDCAANDILRNILPRSKLYNLRWIQNYMFVCHLV
jgi:hypothetical protein